MQNRFNKSRGIHGFLLAFLYHLLYITRIWIVSLFTKSNVWKSRSL